MDNKMRRKRAKGFEKKQDQLRVDSRIRRVDAKIFERKKNEKNKR